MNSEPSLTTLLLPDQNSNLPNETHHLKERLYGEYLDQEREERQLRNEVKRKAVHKSLDLPMEDPLQITNTTTHNHNGALETSDVQRLIGRLEQQVADLSKAKQVDPSNVVKQFEPLAKKTGKRLLGKFLPLFLAGVLGATGVGIPVAGFTAYQFFAPILKELTNKLLDKNSIPEQPSIAPAPPQEESAQSNPMLQQELKDMKLLIDELRNRKYVVRHFRKKADGTLEEVPVAPLTDSTNGQ